MTTYLVRRTAWAVVVLLIVTGCTFLLVHLTPADPARAMAGAKSDPRTVALIRTSLGLDRPLLEQLVGFYERIARLDLGTSYRQGRPVAELIGERLPATVELAVAGLAIAILLGVGLGVAGARRPGSRLDRLSTALASVLAASPAYLVGILLLFGLAFLPAINGLPLFPLVNHGYDPLDLRQLALPALALGLVACPFYLRLTRLGVLDELRQDHIRTARAKGLGERRVVWRHALRNAAPPLVAQAGVDLGAFLGGVVVIEWAFSWPGIGRQSVAAISQQDVPLILGTVVVASILVVVANLAADLVAAWLDPRAALTD
ncbi:MAG: ABC transporter permease [Chloroflexota bacterium]